MTSERAERQRTRAESGSAIDWSPPGFLQAIAVAYVALLGTENINLGGLGSASAAIGAVLIAASALVFAMDPDCGRTRTEGRRLLNERARLVVVTAFLYLGYAVISLAWTRDLQATSSRLLTMAGVIVLVPVLGFSLPRKSTVAMTAFAAAMGALAITTLWAQLSNPTLLRTAAADFDPNDLSGYLASGVAVTLVLVFRASGIRQALLVANAVLLVVAVLVTGSRMGALALGVALLSGLVVGLRSIIRGVALGAGIILVVASVAAGVALTSVSRALTVTRGVSLDDTSSRNLIWTNILAHADDWLPWGVGSGATRSLDAHHGHASVAHNAWLSVSVETGVIGVGLFALIVAGALWASRRSPYADYVMAMAPVLLVTSMSLSWEYRKLLWVWVAMGLVLVVSTRSSVAHDGRLQVVGGAR